ncbi:MAG: acetylxylan esterase [Bacteroides sp.]|nr:acetylxylan esterase [Bacteroides sp.]
MKHLFTLFFFLCIPHCVSAQPAQQLVNVQVVPDRANFIYREGEAVTFHIAVLKNGIPLPQAEIRYRISEDRMTPHTSGQLTLKEGTATVQAGTMSKAGFLRCQVVATYQGREYEGIATVGFSPGQLQPVTQLPDDFLEFWERAKAEAAEVPMDAKMTLVPEKCTAKVNVYHVSLQHLGTDNRLYGMLCVPKGKGTYPAILKFPGAGVRAYQGDIENASRGYIVFEIGIHGIPVDMQGDVYRNLYEGPLKNYHSFNLDDRDRYYYKRVYLGCVRAIDFLYTLPEFDGTHLIAYGGSQGGALSIVTTALDNRVTGLVAFYPALCDVAGYLHGRAGGWPHMFNNPANHTPEKISTAAYYDVVNFARHIRVPGYYSFGYNDRVCPPTTVYSALNVIQAPKELFITEESAHYAYPEQRSRSWQWIRDLLNK